jgi:glucosamine--fructose-6-phosphate aminotransferase (isomerizing)
VSDLTLLLKYMAGRLPTADFEFDFGMKGTAPNILATFFDCIGKMIDEMTRPVDAIKHQAKTVTVGTSRLVEQVDGLLFDTLRTYGFDRSHLTTTNVLVLKRLQEVVRHIKGTTLYRVSGLNLLGEPVEHSTIDVEQKAGSSALLSSRAESDNRLRGTKQIIVKNGNVFIGKGRRDHRSILVIPIMSLGTTIDRLLLLHVDFYPEVDLRQKVEALGGKYQHIRQLVEETRLLWQDGYLNLVQMEDLFGLSAEKISELILTQSLK